MIIDVWLQHPGPRMLAEPMFESLRRWSKDALPQDCLPLATTLTALDAAGVAQGLLSAWHGPGGALIGNDEVAACVAQAPRRLLGIGSVDLARPAQVRAEVRRCAEELGFRGMRILPWLWRLAPNDRLFYPLYAACCEFGLPFCTQIGHTGPLMPSEPGRPMLLDTVLLDFPELVVVGGHIGYPWTEEAIALATKYPNFHIDTSAYTCARYPAALVEFMRGHGRHKVLFGSNWPMIAPAKCLAGLDALALDVAAKDLFLYGNARRVFRL